MAHGKYVKYVHDERVHFVEDIFGRYVGILVNEFIDAVEQDLLLFVKTVNGVFCASSCRAVRQWKC